MKRCCLACSIGQLYLKLENREDLIPSRDRIGDTGENENVAEGPSWGEEAEGFSPVTGQTKTRAGPVIQAPLR